MAASTQYIVTGTSMTIGPQSQTWNYVELGTGFDSFPVYARKKTVTLDFGDCSVAQYAEWANKCGGSQTSIDMLSPSGIVFTQYNNVVLTLTKRPAIQNVNAIGGFTVEVSEVVSNT